MAWCSLVDQPGVVCCSNTPGVLIGRYRFPAAAIPLSRSPTIECLGRSDALYHNFEHTLLVTLVGRDIIRGRSLTERIEPADYDHLIVACLLHDIGYVRGVLRGDTSAEFVVDQGGKTVTLPRGASDAALMPYHIERSKLFVHERLGKSPTIAQLA